MAGARRRRRRGTRAGTAATPVPRGARGRRSRGRDAPRKSESRQFSLDDDLIIFILLLAGGTLAQAAQAVTQAQSRAVTPVLTPAGERLNTLGIPE